MVNVATCIMFASIPVLTWLVWTMFGPTICAFRRDVEPEVIWAQADKMRDSLAPVMAAVTFIFLAIVYGDYILYGESVGTFYDTLFCVWGFVVIASTVVSQVLKRRENRTASTDQPEVTR